MIVRNSLIALALAAVAGTAFAAPADGTQPAKAPAAKTHAKCEKRSAAGHCEKWATAKPAAKTSAKPADATKSADASKPAK
ncbi:hypothetical protein LYSHEL_21480 [Lysobacter helvus]|uniref:Uncharacterized protein n=2 Tax=Lysobacteraceae TaxID=32033 RepID=A0ABN6FU30_9GAMM|nr:MULTISPECIES: hypothetical protein [Lysobacter]BCT93125.1 hypothetical protein LYSCAS_21490 [Lysobacter caseinilyticus]BCT96277.1 hypothetical protein LYSHEL_21480 [Lysobacter helvus]